MAGERRALVDALSAFTRAHPTWVLFDEQAEALYEVASGKRLALPLRDVVQVVERGNAMSGEPYLLVELGDGRQLALADVGIAFPPVLPDVPQAPELPGVVCLRDFHTVRERLEHLLHGHPDRAPGREAVDLVTVAIAILDGARWLGFDISEEERALEGLLAEVERRR